MAIRIEPNIKDTEEIIQLFLPLTLEGKRASFLVGAGESFLVLARIRTMISRKRSSMRARGKKPRRFTLMSSVHPETHDGVRQDCIIVWIEVRESHMLSEVLDDLLAKESA
jgi:hypothetical protein